MEEIDLNDGNGIDFVDTSTSGRGGTSEDKLERQKSRSCSDLNNV